MTGEWELAARFIGDLNNDGDINDTQMSIIAVVALVALRLLIILASPANENSLVAWFSGNSFPGGGSTNAVKSKRVNALGLYDMSGNVWELCFDLTGTKRNSRSGDWSSRNDLLQLAYYHSVVPSQKDIGTGIRLARH